MLEEVMAEDHDFGAQVQSIYDRSAARWWGGHAIYIHVYVYKKRRRCSKRSWLKPTRLVLYIYMYNRSAAREEGGGGHAMAEGEAMTVTEEGMGGGGMAWWGAGGEG